MIALWMAYAVAVALALGLAAAAAERGLRLADRQARGVWVAALAGAVVLPAVAYLVGPVSPVSDLLAAVGASGGPRADSAGGSGLAALLTSALAGVGPTASASGGGSGPAALARELAVSLEGPLLLLWGLLSVFLGARLAVGWWRARRRPGWRRERIDGRPVLVAPDVGPALVGLLRTEIVVPEWFREISPDLRQLALRHEEEHRRSRDPWLALGAEVALVLMPWNPALHWAVRRLRRAIELDCDQRIVRDGVDRRRYGRLLVAVGGRSGGQGIGRAVALSEGTTELERRVTMLRSKNESWKGLRMAGAAGLAVAALALACETPVPPGEEQTEAPEAHVEGETPTAGQIQAVGDGLLRPGAPGAPVMVIDGVIANAPVDLDALDVARVEVVKGEAARALYGERAANGVVQITTRDSDGSPAPEEPEPAGPTTVERPEPDASEAAEGASSGRLRGMKVPGAEFPLVVVDGVIMGRDMDLEEINALEIEKIEVVKGDAAREAYGERAPDGLIRITTKGGG